MTYFPCRILLLQTHSKSSREGEEEGGKEETEAREEEEMKSKLDNIQFSLFKQHMGFNCSYTVLIFKEPIPKLGAI